MKNFDHNCEQLNHLNPHIGKWISCFYIYILYKWLHNVYYYYVYKTKAVTIYYVGIHEKIEDCLSGWENLWIKIMG